jgi:hypothetical protein
MRRLLLLCIAVLTACADEEAPIAPSAESNMTDGSNGAAPEDPAAATDPDELGNGEADPNDPTEPDGEPDEAKAPGKPDGRSYPVAAAKQVVTADQASARVMVFKYDVTDWSKPESIAWTWTAPGNDFKNLSDVKYTKDGKRLLVAASGGGIAVVQISDKRILTRAKPGGNTHAIEELPDGSLVSASSTGGFLKLYSKSGDLKQTISFPDAHSAYWDGARKRLYAGGGPHLKSFKYASGKLTQDASWNLPNGSGGAHDLFPNPYSDQLYISYTGNVKVFDRTKHTFGNYTEGPNRGSVKAVGRNPGSEVVCLLRATNAPGPEPRTWSSDTVIFDQPGKTPATVTRVRKGAQFYKARWAVATP